MIKITSIAAAAAALVFTGLSFGAATPAFAKDVTVRYNDLDLTTAEGQKRLDRRIDAAARDACGYDEITTGSKVRSPEAVQCYNKARGQVSSHVAAAVQNAVDHTRVATK